MNDIEKRARKVVIQREYMARKKAKASPEQLEIMQQKQRAYSRKSYHGDPLAKEKSNVRARRNYDPARAKINNAKNLEKNGERYNANRRAKYVPHPRPKLAPDWAKANPERVAANRKRWREENPDYCKKRYATDVQYAIVARCRARLTKTLARATATKTAPTMELLGCTGAELKVHLEAQFTDGMSWDNRADWHVDHIKPCCQFDLTNPEQQQACFHYSNLRPLWKKDNLARPRQSW